MSLIFLCEIRELNCYLRNLRNLRELFICTLREPNLLSGRGNGASFKIMKTLLFVFGIFSLTHT